MPFDPDKYLSATAPKTGKVNPREIYDYLHSKGVDDHEAKGILANIESESGFDPSAIGDGGTSGGLFQHHNERFSGLRKNPNWKNDWKSQVDYALNEPEGIDFLNKKFNSPEEAAYDFTTTFERPADTHNQARKRSQLVSKFSDLNPSSSFDPDKYLASFPDAREEVGSAPEAGLRSFTKSATMGLSEPLGAAMSTGIEKLFPNKAQEELNKNKSLMDLYRENRESIRDRSESLEQDHPMASVAGDIAGLAAPGGAFNKIYGTTGKLLGRGAEGKKIARVISDIALQGGLSNAAYQGLDPTKDSNLPLDFALGAGGELAGAGIGKGLEYLSEATPKIASKLMNSAVGSQLKDVKRGKNLGKDLLERNVFGTKRGLAKKADEMLDVHESALTDLLESSTEKLNPKTILGELESLKTHYVDTPGSEAEIKAIDDLINSVTSNPKFSDLTAKEGNKIKRSLYKKVNTGYDRDVVGLKKELDKRLAKGYRKSIEEVVPGAKEANKELSVYGRLQDTINNSLAKEEKGLGSLIGFRDLPSIAVAGTVGGLPGGALGYAANKLANSTLGRTAAALGLKNASGLLKKISEKTSTKYLAPSISNFTLPEKKETLDAQVDSLKQGRVKGVLVTPGSSSPKVPQGFKSLDTESGKFIYDPKKITEQEIKKKVKDNTFHEILGHVEPKSDRTTKTLVAKKNGKELKSSVTSPKNVQKQFKSLKKQFPDADIEVGGEKLALKTLRKRVA